MNKTLFWLVAGSALPLAACVSSREERRADAGYRDVPVEPCKPSAGDSAVVGRAVGGLAGAVWADTNNDGCVDGYVREGRYYAGDPVVRRPAEPAA